MPKNKTKIVAHVKKYNFCQKLFFDKLTKSVPVGFHTKSCTFSSPDLFGPTYSKVLKIHNKVINEKDYPSLVLYIR